MAQFLIPGFGVVQDDGNDAQYLIPSSGVFNETISVTIFKVYWIPTQEIKTMKKNIAGQVIGVQLNNSADGLPFTGVATVLITIDGGTQASSLGPTPTHEGNGYHTYLPTQAETNGDQIGFTFIGTGAVTSTVQVYTTFPQTADNNVILLTLPIATDIVTSGAITTLAGAIVNVDLVDTTTTNADMRGTDGANIIVPPSVAQFDARTLLAADYFDPAADVVSNVTLVGTTTLNTDMRGTDGANTVAPDNAGITANGVAIGVLNNISIAQIFSGGDIDGFTLEESQKLILSSQVGIASGMETTTVTIRAADNSKVRITGIVDANGNRISLILDATG